MFKETHKYRLGKKTYIAFLFTKNKFLLFTLFIYTLLVYYFIFGTFKTYLENYLSKNISYITVSLVGFWAFLFIIAFSIIILLRASVQYRMYSFVFHKHAFHVRHGIFFVKEHVIPYNQIQNVEIKRPVIYMLFGLVELDILTGLGSKEIGENRKGDKISLLPILDKRLADKIMHELTRLAAVHNGYQHPGQDTFESTNTKRRRKR